MKNGFCTFLFASLGFMLTSCGEDQFLNQLKEAWNPKNDPVLLSGNDIQYNLAELPLSGETPNKGWSDDYWPHYRGGLSYRWLRREVHYPLLSQQELASSDLRYLSPAEKYDIFLGNFDFPLVRSERQRTTVTRTDPSSPEYDPSYSIPSWFGLCHGWAPAAMNFLEPRTIAIQGPSGITVPFGSSDIKALLTYYQQSRISSAARTYFMSERCNLSFRELDERLAKGEINQEEYYRLRNEGPCKGVNAGAFHLVLANELGRKQQHIIIDSNRDAEVWNYPVTQFQSVITGTMEGASPGAAEGTVREITMQTTIRYTIGSVPQWGQVGAYQRSLTYIYALELNASNEIIGGRWITDLPRPDFLWRQTAPVFQGYFRPLEMIYQQATQSQREI